MNACHCKDFTRSAVMRHAAAQAAGAGNGLRAIEPGMPLPAGTGLSRRSFLARSSGLALAVFGGSALAPRAFEEGIADAMGAARQNTVLVSVFLDGGLDTLSLLAPTTDATYQALRPTLKLAPDPTFAFRDDPQLQWHSAAAPLKSLHEADKLTVVPAIGYSSPNQSHFTSRHFYEVGELNETGQVGWLGRWLDRNGRADNPLQGLSLDTTLAPALAAANMPVAAVASPTNFALGTDGVGTAVKASMNQAYGTLGRLATADPQLAVARGAAAQVVGIQERLADLYGKQITDTPAGVTYPANSGFANKLRALAKMLHMGLPIRCVALDGNGGYDTHENQAATLTSNLTQFSQALQAFQADLEGRLEGSTPLAERVIVHVWSEFGRRPAENGSGTDHGAAGASLLMGSTSTLAKGMQGEFTGVATLDNQQNLRMSTDFRSVYKTLLEDWLGGDISGVLPNAGQFTNLGLIKTS
jgi:uncharacterized protein (DUF1501 family)